MCVCTCETSACCVSEQTIGMYQASRTSLLLRWHISGPYAASFKGGSYIIVERGGGGGQTFDCVATTTTVTLWQN